MPSLENQLHRLGPEQTLSRGYAVVLNEQGTAVRNIATLHRGESSLARFAKGGTVVRLDEIPKP
ncbi:MAG: hypothetical protein CMN80_05585 [Spongiibacter sp.]|nr:hypothetical protein [Spongiibacter sp.]